MDVQCFIFGGNSGADRSDHVQSGSAAAFWKKKYVVDWLCGLFDRTICVFDSAGKFLLAVGLLYYSRYLLCTIKFCYFRNAGDVVEFGQWKTHLRQESFIFAIGSVGTKIGNGVTAAVLTQLLAAGGYVSKAGAVTQPQSAIDMIMNIYKVGPMIVWISVIVVLVLYRLDKKYDRIMQDLSKREANGEL